MRQHMMLQADHNQVCGRIVCICQGLLGHGAALIAGSDRVISVLLCAWYTEVSGGCILQAFMGEVYAAFVFISVLFGTVVDKRYSTNFLKNYIPRGPKCSSMASNPM